MTKADIAEQLRPYHPNLYEPAVYYFNASLEAFIEVAWRWRAVVELIGKHQPDSFDSAEEDEQHCAELDRSCSTFLTSMASIDPTMVDSKLDSVWVETIISDY